MSNKTIFNSKPIGKSGTSIASGVYTEEYLSALQGHEAAQIYNKMRRSDPKIRGILAAIFNPIKRADWDIEAVSDDTKDVEAASLIRHIFFNDIKWRTKLHEILTFVIHGYSAFEVIHANFNHPEYGQYTGIANLAFRSQTTITEWIHDEVTGFLKKIHQEQTGDVTTDAYIDAENLLFFFNEKEGDDNGFSLLRPMYGAYKRKLLSEELKIIGIERFAIATPTLKVPRTVKPTDNEYADAETLLAAYTAAQNSYIMYPEGYELTLHNNTFDPEKVQRVIKAENEAMADSVVASFLELGTGGNGGAYALGTDLSDFFLNGIEHIAGIITEIVNTNLIPTIISMNYGEGVGVYPTMKVSGISDKAGKELMEVVTGYASSGIITVDEPLEDHIRRVHKLPKKAEGELLDNQESEDKTQDNDDSDTPPEPDNEPIEDASEDDKEEGGDDTKKLGEIVRLKDAKTPRGLIDVSGKELRELMISNLNFIGEKYIADIMRNYEKLSKTDKIKATDNVTLGGKARYKRELKGKLSSISAMSFDMVAKEVPVEGVKLSDKADHEVYKLLDDKDLKILEKEYSRLPKHVRAVLIRRADQIIEGNTTDLANAVKFQFQSSISSSEDPNIIRQDLEGAAKKYSEGGAVQRGAANSAAFTVNEARTAYFDDDEVANQIASFTYVNPDPKSEICKTLAGYTFAVDNAEFRRYNAPNHHNCKSYIRANLKTSKNLPEISETLPTISEAAQKSITLKEGR